MKSQRGNIIVYLLIGLVLFGLLLGGLWWVRNRVANTPTAPVVTTQPQNTTPETDVKQDEKPAESPTETTPGGQSQTGTTTPNTQAPPAALLPESQTPRTGPSPQAVAASGPLENTLISSLMLAGVTYIGVLFSRSRNAIR